jgi:formiminoglutamate deiminase
VTSFWAELAWLGGAEAAAGVLIEVDGDRIARIDTGVTRPPGDAMRLDGLTLPGIANAHSHAFHRVLRGRTQRGTGSFWTWREEMYRVAAGLDPQRYHDLAVAVFGEMVAAGFTAVGEFHYLHHDQDGTPYPDPNAMGTALLAAASRVGIRITLLDTLYLHGGIGEDGTFVELSPVQRRFADPHATAWAERVAGLSPGPLARVGAAVHSVRAAAPDDIGVVRAWCDEARAPLHAHVSEQPAENVQAFQAFGQSPTTVFAEAGALGSRFTAVHATHLTEPDVNLLGGSGTNVCLCPTTERDLADGIGPSRELTEAGARLAIGSDSQAVIDPFEETRAIELNTRLATRVRGNHSTNDLLAAATTGGYRAIGWPEGGTLAEGALADFVTVGLDSVRLEGTEPLLALEAVTFAATAADVTTTVVGGTIVYAD